MGKHYGTEWLKVINIDDYLETLQQEIECDQFSLAKWSPMASEINRNEFC
jgi:lipid II:glycine glycyltransferase (peptidoglycan interpeptide bridge formation enzyme)